MTEFAFVLGILVGYAACLLVGQWLRGDLRHRPDRRVVGSTWERPPHWPRERGRR